MLTEPTHIGGGVLDLVLTGIPDVAEVWVGSQDGTPDHSAIFIVVVLEQPIPHLVCTQYFYVKNSVDWELVRGDV